MRSTHNTLQGVVMTSFGGTCPYQWFRYTLLVPTVAWVHFWNIKPLVYILISTGSNWVLVQNIGCFTSGFWVSNLYSNNSYQQYNWHWDESGGKNQAVVWLAWQHFWLRIFFKTTQAESNTIINAPFSVICHQLNHHMPSTWPLSLPTSLPMLLLTSLPAVLRHRLPQLLPTAISVIVCPHPSARAGSGVGSDSGSGKVHTGAVVVALAVALR